MAMLPKLLEQDRKQAGWSVGQAAWRLGVSIREYRELEGLLRQDRDRAGRAAIAGQTAKPRTIAMTSMSAVIPTRKALNPASAASESNSSRSRLIPRSPFMAYPILRSETLASRSKG